jgi:hypothetical protein
LGGYGLGVADEGAEMDKLEDEADDEDYDDRLLWGKARSLYLAVSQ